MDLHRLKTPSLVLDAGRVKANAEMMLGRARALGVRFRPHIKTHKCIEVGLIQTGGSPGPITVSTLAEAEAFADHGFRDILYAVPIEPGKFGEAASLAGQLERFGVLTDDPGVPAALEKVSGSTDVIVDVYLKIDCGSHRCGLLPESPATIEVARAIADSPHLRFAGILTHAGHSYAARDRAGIEAVARQERDSMVAAAEHIRNAGIPVPTVSVGSTPTMTFVDHLKGVDEIRPGNYIFFDAFQATLGSCSAADCALTVLAAVIHRDATLGKVVIDAGAIALSKDPGPGALDPGCGYGRVLDIEGNDLGLRVASMSQEHGVIPVRDHSMLDRLPVGTRLRILANHSCLTAAQHSSYQVLDGGRITDEWEIQRGW
jgi:D-serine deaminase-like pyridoxal phosphate-dependent protein